MSVLPLIIEPDPRLKIASEPVTIFDDKLKTFISDMIQTMHHDVGVGLAAIQVGVPKQLFVLDLGDNDEMPRAEGFYPMCMINPKITWASVEYIIAKEGCLSVPSIIVEVPRPASVNIAYFDENGISKSLETSGWLARVIQHEMDHLNGTTLLNYLSTLKKDLALTKLKKLRKQIL